MQSGPLLNPKLDAMQSRGRFLKKLITITQDDFSENKVYKKPLYILNSYSTKLSLPLRDASSASDLSLRLFGNHISSFCSRLTDASVKQLGILAFRTNPRIGNLEITDIFNRKLARMANDNGIKQIRSACKSNRC